MQCHIRWLQHLRRRFAGVREQSHFLAKSGFSHDWGSDASWAYCHSWYKSTWTSLHHVMKNGGLRITTEFLRRSRYALHVIPSYYEQDRWRLLSWLPSSTSRADEKPCRLPHRNDGWHHVSSTSTQTARWKGICPSSHQWSQWTRGLQQLDTPEAKWSSWRCPDSPFSMGTTMQTWSHNNQSQVTQGQVEPTWQKTSLQNELLWDIHSCCDMVRHQAYDHLWNCFLLGPSTSGLCYGISTGSNQDGHLHRIATRDSNQAWEFQTNWS